MKLAYLSTYQCRAHAPQSYKCIENSQSDLLALVYGIKRNSFIPPQFRSRGRIANGEKSIFTVIAREERKECGKRALPRTSRFYLAKISRSHLHEIGIRLGGSVRLRKRTESKSSWRRTRGTKRRRAYHGILRLSEFHARRAGVEKKHGAVPRAESSRSVRVCRPELAGHGRRVKCIVRTGCRRAFMHKGGSFVFHIKRIIGRVKETAGITTTGRREQPRVS